MNVPVTVYTEMTPNPATMKFVANKYLLGSGDSVEFTQKSEAKGYSPLAEALFNFPFVKSVFITANFVTITKTDNVPWDFITMELREFVREFLGEGKEVLIQMPIPVEKKVSTETKTVAEPSELDEPIIALLDQYVRPAVENDGGAIDYVGFKEGTVTVVLKGACSGCPSSTATLKGGIETLLKQHMPEITQVVAFNG
ncbi:MAG: NifU family protein [Flavobacteriia bacterium]|jgi:Fe-S cluster biogenesis protein NfuA|nr:NifU family protein [Flavobacteriia bacterium]NBV67598.1 NifU family protein [Flavobacteriia bacterium]NBV90899.1 NifU family protein [Flavobacteriia bacterium]NBY39504.1 NifU family protein [Flavobacteriia bacterium]